MVERYNLIIDAMKYSGKVKGFKVTTEENFDAIVLVQRNMRKNMKVGGFRLAAILYYTSNQCTPSNDPLKILINLRRK